MLQYTRQSTPQIGLKKTALEKARWPANSLDLNPIDKLRASIKRRVYQDGRQFFSCADLQKTVKDAAASITPVDIKKLTSSVDSRVMKILKTCGNLVSC